MRYNYLNEQRKIKRAFQFENNNGNVKTDYTCSQNHNSHNEHSITVIRVPIIIFDVKREPRERPEINDEKRI